MSFVAGFCSCVALIALMRLRRMWRASSEADLFYTRSLDRLLTRPPQPEAELT